MDRKEVLKLLKSRHFDANYEPPPESVILTIYDTYNLGSLGNYTVLSGLPKAGKSLYMSAILSSALSIESNVFNLKLNVNCSVDHIGYFDTESNDVDFYKNLKRIKSLAGINRFPKKFNAYRTRRDGYQMNKTMITVYIESVRPKVVVIDGILDLVKNFNDESESRELVDWLKRISDEYNVLIIGIIHTGKKDGFTLGHLGSMIDRYAQSVLEIVKDSEYNVYTLRPKYLRSATDFTPQSIQFNGSFFQTCTTPQAPGIGKKNRSS